jgi:hypothetical protein
MFFGWNIGVAMRGVFRRSPIVDAGLWVPQTSDGAYADVCWLFGVALLGRFAFVPETRCLKRFYPGSTHTEWRAPKALQLPRLMTRYLRAYAPSRRQRAVAIGWVWFGATANRMVSLLNSVAQREVIREEAVRAAFRLLLGG